MGRKHSPGCLCCGTTCEDACISVDPLTTATVAIANDTGTDESFSITFPTSADFDCSTSGSECRQKDVEKITDGECTSEWDDSGIQGVMCDCGRCTYVPDDPDDPIPFPTPPGAPFPATTFNRMEISQRTGWKVCEWSQKGYRVSVTVSPGSTTGKVVVTVFYEVGEVRFWNWLFARQFRYRSHTYACPGGPLPTSTGAWSSTTNPFPLADPPYPCEVLKPINGMAGDGCDTDITGTPVCDAIVIAVIGYDQTLSCHPNPVCGYLVASDPVEWFTATWKTSRYYATSCQSTCDAINPVLPLLYPTYFGYSDECSQTFDEQSVRYERTYTYLSAEIDCADLRDGPITLSRTGGVTSDETIELIPEYDLSCDGGFAGYICDTNDPLVMDSVASSITVPWQVTVTFA